MRKKPAEVLVQQAKKQVFDCFGNRYNLYGKKSLECTII